MPKPELLSPAGDLERLKFAIIYGADAVYLGGKSFGMRAFAPNFTEQELAAGIEFAHRRGVRVYVTVNNLLRNEELAPAEKFLKKVASLGVDAVILSDPGLLLLAKRAVPQLPCHLSTQASVTNWQSASFWQRQGIDRVILSRELSLEEIKNIREKTSVFVEVFVHGAMCVAFSGRCLLSAYLTGRSANRGECTQPCRWEYTLHESKRPGEHLTLVEEDGGSFILSSQDLCMIEHIPSLIEAGVDGLKIEGRMKGVHYVATVTRAYRLAIDACRENSPFDPRWREELEKVSHRPYGTGFYFGPPQQMVREKESYIRTHSFVGIVRGYDRAARWVKLEQRNPFGVGDLVEIMEPGKDPPFLVKVDKIFDEAGVSVPAARHPCQNVFLPVDREVAPYSLVRRLAPPKRKQV